MKHADYLRQMLAPLGVYRLEGTCNGGELEAVGAALDGCAAALETVEREMLLTTAEGDGLERIEALLARRPVTSVLERRRAALAALLRIGGDSFTLSAINDNLAGCGLNAVASETEEPGVVEVRFPEVPGIPDGFAEMRAIIEDILPGLTGPAESVVICDRREAIGWVLKNSRPKDVIVLCGKGHETYQEVCGEKRHMDERELVAAYTNG